MCFRIRSVVALLVVTTMVSSCVSDRPRTALHAAARSEPERIIDLIGEEYEINNLDPDGITPLMEAVTYRNARGVAILLAMGADPNRPSDLHPPPLVYAAGVTCADDGRRMLICRLLLAYGADPNAKGYRGYTPLIRAVCRGDAALAQLLLQNGADTEMRTEGKPGNTALHWATERGEVTLVRALIASGARVDALNGYGQTPAARTDNPEILAVLAAAAE